MRRTFRFTMLWSESALAGGGGCGMTLASCTLGRWACRVKMSSICLRFFGLVRLYVCDFPPLRALKKVSVRANLQLMANDKSRSPLSLSASRPYAPSILLSSSLHRTDLSPVRALASSSTNTLSLASVPPSPPTFARKHTSALRPW